MKSRKHILIITIILFIPIISAPGGVRFTSLMLQALKTRTHTRMMDIIAQKQQIHTVLKGAVVTRRAPELPKLLESLSLERKQRILFGPISWSLATNYLAQYQAARSEALLPDWEKSLQDVNDALREMRQLGIYAPPSGVRLERFVNWSALPDSVKHVLLTSGAVYHPDRLTSTSALPEAELFRAFPTLRACDTKLLIHPNPGCSAGRFIASLSETPNEGEVTFPDDSRFKVVKIKTLPMDKREIELLEESPASCTPSAPSEETPVKVTNTETENAGVRFLNFANCAGPQDPS